MHHEKTAEAARPTEASEVRKASDEVEESGEAEAGCLQMSEPCARHDDICHRVDTLERMFGGQVDENAKIWKAINLIREEKATDSATLKKVEAAVDELAIKFEKAMKELHDDILALKLLPAKRWNDMVTSTIKELVALVVGGGLAYLFLNK